ncbi:hypothetical protein EF096_01910 [Pseudomonas neustonica]|uniref:Uncharacterized protein n=1 Tax=Pseudomonas neustonica TaxID=2487346 RepID=A0ABX9XND2_9PSED|nr:MULTISPECIES: hypothetical protein [Pseudomonas]ROZ86915.1 hypothetical protein EF099_00790 [Pseudomonas sp. SSM44]ROZ88469.1 hypothetical protein EF096_01910 [Pseudomonas neustonica]
MNILTLGRKALIGRLGEITQSNGYRTNAGLNVRSGWFNEVIKESTSSFPLIVLQKARDKDPLCRAQGMRKHTGFRVVAAVSAGLDDYEDVLDDLELDLIECLMPTEGVPLGWTPAGIPQLSLGASEQVPPGEGLAAGTVVLPVYLHTLIETRLSR